MFDYEYPYDYSDYEIDQEATDAAAYQADIEARNDDHLIEIWEASRPVTLVQSSDEEPF